MSIRLKTKSKYNYKNIIYRISKYKNYIINKNMLKLFNKKGTN